MGALAPYTAADLDAYETAAAADSDGPVEGLSFSDARAVETLLHSARARLIWIGKNKPAGHPSRIALGDLNAAIQFLQHELYGESCEGDGHEVIGPEQGAEETVCVRCGVVQLAQFVPSPDVEGMPY